LLPLATLLTLWRLRVALLGVQSNVDRPADKVAAGSPLTYPRRVGLFRIDGALIDPVHGYVGLRVALRHHMPAHALIWDSRISVLVGWASMLALSASIWTLR
jgi:hypothetical protein